jgi:uncharacterized Zn-finger protein
LDLFVHFKTRSITSDRLLRERAIKLEVLDNTDEATKPTKRTRTPSRKQAALLQQQEEIRKFAEKPDIDDMDPSDIDRQPNLDPICDDNVVTEIELPFHVTGDSLNEGGQKETANVFICSKCPRRFPKITGLRRHLQIHQNRKLVCEDCGKTFSSRESLLVHKRHVHLQLRPFKCSQCGQTFKNKNGMLEHTRNLHSKERNFICEICSGTFKTQSRLASHIKGVHKAQKVYKCTECDLVVKSKYVLATHYRNLHTNIRPFICHLCDRAFGLKNSLEKHMRIHIKGGQVKSRDFPCDLCEKMFVSASTVRSHKKTIHRAAKAIKADSDGSSEQGS